MIIDELTTRNNNILEVMFIVEEDGRLVMWFYAPAGATIHIPLVPRIDFDIYLRRSAIPLRLLPQSIQQRSLPLPPFLQPLSRLSPIPLPPPPPTQPHQPKLPQRRPPPIAVSIPINYRPLGVPPDYYHNFWFRIHRTKFNGPVSIRLPTFSERQKRVRKNFSIQQPPQAILKLRTRKQERIQLCSKRGLGTSKSPSIPSPIDYNNHSYNWKLRPPANATCQPPNWHMTSHFRSSPQLRRRKCECKMMPVRLEISHNTIGLVEMIQAHESEDDDEEEELET
ncbi:uncharacterized protein LOC132918500 [Rhopalosiphum padi]|uniref:uncharacterized protein LOC132918500 n=1 Tax=Rhopalosiphum padi TaxID=40932 RepID=UPI00298DEFEB|nr:uncharacterized protein LOC132918500 [Rhopalosiphum padi]